LPARFRRSRVLIVGCGDVGQRVATHLPPAVRVLALTSSPERCAALRTQGIVPLLGNLDQPASLRRLAGLADRVLHLAPPPSEGGHDPRTRALAHALRGRTRPLALVYGSTSGVYGDCGSCKCKMLEGRVAHGPHQSKALSAEEETAGLILTCCGVPLTDVVLESRQVTDESAFPIKRMPSRVISLEKKSQDVMLVKLQLPANDAMRYHAGQYVEFLLRDGSRRSYSMANAPHLAGGQPTATCSAP
jgi:hypothetical protein